MNSRKQGSIAVAKAIEWFTSNGYNVSVPISETQRYDLIVEEHGICYRVEVKSSASRKIHLETKGGNRSWGGSSKSFSTEDAEYLFAVTSEGEFLIPLLALPNKTTLIPKVQYQC